MDSPVLLRAMLVERNDNALLLDELALGDFLGVLLFSLCILLVVSGLLLLGGFLGRAVRIVRLSLCAPDGNRAIGLGVRG